MTRPRLLDLYCGAGGAAKGYHDAGFDIVGIDNQPQPNYPYEFIQHDALDALAKWPRFVKGFDAIHASPPCQTFARVTDWRGSRDNHQDLLEPTLDHLHQMWSIPWVVENVPEAPLRADYILCGSQFGLRVRRHRIFQRGNWHNYQLLPLCQHRDLLPFEHKRERAYADALGCQWMTNREARQAIPPAYTTYIGTQMLDALGDPA